MEVARLTQVKNDLSRYVALVRRGGRVRILVRGVAVADIVPIAPVAGHEEDDLAELERRGWLRRGKGGVDDELLRKGPRIRGKPLSATVADERRSSR